MISTFSDLYNQVLSNLDEKGNTSTTLTNAKNFINQAHLQRCAMYPWPFLEWDSAETFACTPGTRFYALHTEFWRPLYFYNQTTKSYLVETSTRSLAPSGARWNDDVGHPLQFRLPSRTAVLNQPASSSVVSIVSTSGSDVAVSQGVHVRGMTANGVTSETITPNGTSIVSSVNSYTKLLEVNKLAPWIGNMTMTSNGATVTNLFLFAAEFARSYQQLEFLTVPGSADVIEYRFFKYPNVLSNDTDIPNIPAPHSQILVWDALLLFAGYNTDLSPKSMSIWSVNQQRMEQQMYSALFESQSVESEPRYVRYTDGDTSNTPRIFTS